MPSPDRDANARVGIGGDVASDMVGGGRAGAVVWQRSRTRPKLLKWAPATPAPTPAHNIEMLRTHAPHFPPLHPDLARPRAAVVEGCVGRWPPAFRVRVTSSRLLITCDNNPEFWVDLDTAHSTVRSGNYDIVGYDLLYPQRRWSVVRSEHRYMPQFWLGVTVYT